MERRSVLTPEEIARVDATYRRIDDSASWVDVPVDQSVWAEYAERLRNQRTKLGDRGLDRAVRGAMRAAAFDSGAIEGLYPADQGFTITAAFQASAWEAGLHERGAVTEELVAGQLRGYELALDCATGHRPVTEVWIRSLHEVVSAGQETYTVRTAVGTQEQALPRGAYKSTSNHVALADGQFHAYAPPGDVPTEMHRLVTELSTPRFEAAHPVLQAAYAHHALAQIHPFADGNGRVARIVASVFLFRSQSIPLVVFTGQREQYVQALRQADGGNRSVFADFIMDCAVDTLDLMTNLLAADSQDSIERLANLYRLREGVTTQQVEGALATLIKGPMHAEIAAVLAHLPTGVTGGISWGPAQQQDRVPGYHVIAVLDDMTVASIGIRTSAPFQARVTLRVRPLLSIEPSRMPVALEEATTGSVLRARISDIVPEPSEALLARLRAWVGGVMAQALQTLAVAAEGSRGQP